MVQQIRHFTNDLGLSLVIKNGDVTFSRCSMESSCIGIVNYDHEYVCYVIVELGKLETWTANCTMDIWSISYVPSIQQDGMSTNCMNCFSPFVSGQGQSCLCVHLSVYHLVGAGLLCAPPGCVLHHGAQGEPMSVRSGSRPQHFSFLVVHKKYAK